ncbi:MAG TPA: hypothetical protein VF979_05755 [Streptosporangiaceae bacterium]
MVLSRSAPKIRQREQVGACPQVTQEELAQGLRPEIDPFDGTNPKRDFLEEILTAARIAEFRPLRSEALADQERTRAR